MSLIKCKECNNEISDKAKNCPKCGAKNKQPSGCLKLFGILFVMAVFGQVLLGISQTLNPNHIKKETIKTEETKDFPQIGRISTIKRASLGAYNLDDFNQAVTYISQGDNQAFFSLKSSGKVFDLKPNQEVFVVDVKMLYLQFKVRYVGQTQTFWCDISALR